MGKNNNDGVTINLNAKSKIVVCLLSNIQLKIIDMFIIDKPEILANQEGLDKLIDCQNNLNFEIEFFTDDKQEALVKIATNVLKGNCKTTEPKSTLDEITDFMETRFYENRELIKKYKNPLPISIEMRKEIDKYNETYKL